MIFSASVKFTQFTQFHGYAGGKIGNEIFRVSKNPPQHLEGLAGAEGLAPIFSPLGEKVCIWGKMCLEKVVFGSWGAGAGGWGLGGWRGLGRAGEAYFCPTFDFFQSCLEV